MRELTVDERRQIAHTLGRTHYPTRHLEILCEGLYCSVYRVHGESVVLKVAAPDRIRLEAFFYDLLQRHQIPGIAHTVLASDTLCLEDLDVSGQWRRATQADMASQQIGVACAKWVQALHKAGREESMSNSIFSQGLVWEYDLVNQDTLAHAGKVFSLTRSEGWIRACQISHHLIDSIRPKVDTLTYNDFFYGNLAVSRLSKNVTMFDFDHSGKGLVESDYRNVAASLHGEGRESFMASMPVNAELLAIDEVLSDLYALIVASEREQVPKWALAIIEEVQTMDFLQRVLRVEQFS